MSLDSEHARHERRKLKNQLGKLTERIEELEYKMSGLVSAKNINPTLQDLHEFELDEKTGKCICGEGLLYCLHI